MDEIDFTISLLLMANSRTPYRELAEMFSMSVNSIHKRVKSMVELGIIENFTARLNPISFPHYINILTFGVSKSKDPKAIIEKLGAHECIFNVTQASNNLFYIHACLNNLIQLDPLVSFIRQKGQIDELTIGINSYHGIEIIEDLGDMTLSNLDYLIIYALKDNSRKPVAEVSDEIGASTKTVRRHLNRLIEKKLIELRIDWYPDKTAEFLSFIIINLDPAEKIEKITLMDELHKEFGQKIVFLWAFSNLPDMMVVCFWISGMKELQEIENNLMSRNFESVKVTVLLEGKTFPSWIEQHLEDKIKELKRIST